MDKLKIIKIIVFILTFLLVLGTLMVLGSIFKKTRQAQVPLPSQISLKQPTGSQISQILEKGNQIHILVKEGGLPDRIILMNSQNGNILSTISLY